MTLGRLTLRPRYVAVAALGPGCLVVWALGCGYAVGLRQRAVVQADLRLPRGTRVAVTPFTLYGYARDERQAVSNAAYSSLTAAFLTAGLRVVERSLVDKAVNEYARTKTYDKVGGTQGAVYQEGGDEGAGRVIDVVEVGKTLHSRLVAAGSVQMSGGIFASMVEVRIRITDVVNGEVVSYCEASGLPSVIQGCADSMAGELAARMTGASAAGYGLPLE